MLLALVRGHMLAINTFSNYVAWCANGARFCLFASARAAHACVIFNYPPNIHTHVDL